MMNYLGEERTRSSDEGVVITLERKGSIIGTSLNLTTKRLGRLHERREVI